MILSTPMACFGLALAGAPAAAPVPGDAPVESLGEGLVEESGAAGVEAPDARTIEVPSERGDGLDAQRRADAETPGFVTVIELDHEAGARPSDGLAELLSRAPAANVRSLGGLGQFASVSLRGSSAQQVGIFYEGIPLGDAESGLADLGDLPLDNLETVVIHRGYVPIRYGGATLGGAIDLRGGGVVDTLRGGGRLGFGSFGAYEARAGVALPLAEGQSLRLRVAHAGAEGDFPFYDTGGTPNLLDDDQTSLRINDGYRRWSGLVGWDGRRGDWSWSVQELFTAKSQGLPGPGTAQARSASAEKLGARTLARAERRLGARSSAAWRGAFSWGRRDLLDPESELGVGVDDQRTESFEGYLAPSLSLGLWREAKLGLSADWRGQWVSIDQRAAAPSADRSGDSKRARQGYGVGLELAQGLWQDRVELVPALRVDLIDSDFAVPTGQGEFDEAGADSVVAAASPRFGLRFDLLRQLGLRASVGRYFRPPTTLELFGDRGFARGREDLRPEKGTAFDVGFVFDDAFGSAVGDWGLYAQAAAFGQVSRDLIAWVQAGSITRPINIEGARIWGAEGSLQLTAPKRWVIAQANYTFVHSVNRSIATAERGQPLPNRPRHEAFTRVSVGREFGREQLEPRVFGSFEYVAQNYLDPSGRVAYPPRELAGLGAELHWRRRIHFAFEVRNLFDRRVVAWTPPVGDSGPIPQPMSDFIGYPLPGRSVWGTVSVEFR